MKKIEIKDENSHRSYSFNDLEDMDYEINEVDEEQDRLNMLNHHTN
jgi:hypothetical protein